MARWPCAIGLRAVLITLVWIVTEVQPGPRYSSRIVDTRTGPVRGIIQSSNSLHLEPVEIFYGIPYAAPPVGARRFVSAMEPLPWTGTMLADTPPPACPQLLPDINNRTKLTYSRYNKLVDLLPRLTNQSEDCLRLNIYVPGSGSRGLYAPYAVVVYVHGESYEWNSGNQYDGRILTSYGHVIFITVNYRLGVLGFLKLDEEKEDRGSCCFALSDLEAALRWVNKNIDAFGGDPSRVTLVGHDTGAALVTALLLNTSARGLFHRVSIVSGSLLSPWATTQPGQHRAVLNKLACKTLTCLQALPLQTLMDAVAQQPGGKFLPRMGPWVTTSPSEEVEHAGDTFIDRQMLIGLTSVESFHDFQANQIETGVNMEEKDDILRSFINSVYSYHEKEIFSAVRNEYTEWNTSGLDEGLSTMLKSRDAILSALSDGHTVASLLRLAYFHSRRGAVTYLFHLAHQPDKQLRALGLESVRGDILPYILGDSLTHSQSDMSEHVVAHTIIRFFTNFAKTGDPNSPGAEPDYENDKASSNTWDMFEPVKQLYLSIGEDTRLRSHYRGHKMALWLHLVHQLQSPDDIYNRFHQLGDSDDQDDLFAGVVRPKTVSIGRVTPTPGPALVECAWNFSVPRDGATGAVGGGLAHAFTLAGPWGITLGLACLLLVCNLLLLASVYRRQLTLPPNLPLPGVPELTSTGSPSPYLAKSQSAPELTLLSETPASSSLIKRPQPNKSPV